jgi:hypothetical protein
MFIIYFYLVRVFVHVPIKTMVFFSVEVTKTEFQFTGGGGVTLLV